MKKEKKIFEKKLVNFTKKLNDYISTKDGQWSVKGFIDSYKNVYTISNDTKIVSKILEIHLFPEILRFAKEIGYKIILAEHQNYYPDVTFEKIDNPKIKFAVDFKTTYRNPKKPYLCNGFTLGSHGKYFEDRSSTKNIQFPYKDYLGHFCLGIIYDRNESATIDETKKVKIEELDTITSVISNFDFFAVEKYKIASDKGGSGNTANIGSINHIDDIKNGRGMFSCLGEKWFDDYWMNFNKIIITDENGNSKKINNLKDFVKYRGGDISLIVDKNNKEKR